MNQLAKHAAPKSTSGKQNTISTTHHAAVQQWNGDVSVTAPADIKPAPARQKWNGEYTVTIAQACRSKDNPHAILPCSRPTVYAWIEAGILPKPIALGPRLRGWPVQVLRDWLAAQQSK